MAQGSDLLHEAIGKYQAYSPGRESSDPTNFSGWLTSQSGYSPEQVSSIQSELAPFGGDYFKAIGGVSSGGSFLGDVLGGVKNVAGVLAPAALMTMGIPALAGEPGLGSAIAANYAGGATGAVSDVTGAVPGSVGYNVALSPEDAAAISASTEAPAATIGPEQLGLGAAGALGLASPTGAPATPGLTAAAPAAPAGAAPAVAAGGGAAPATAAAPGGAAATGGGTAVTGNSAVDSILASLKKNALSLGLMGAGLAGAGAVGNKPMPGQETLTNLGNMSADVAKEYLAAARSGNLTAPQQATLDQYTQQAKNQVRQYFESIGQGSSSARMQAEQQVDQTALAMKQQLLQQTLASGLQALGAAQGPLGTIAQYQLGQDQALQQAIGRFATGAGLLAGANAGGQTAEAAKAATTP